MLKDERQDSIVTLCNERKSLTVRETAKVLDISEMTVRRDFDELAAQGRISRVYGGARSLSEEAPQVTQKTEGTSGHLELKDDEKRQAAVIAASLVQPNDIVFLGSGTTIELMIPLLPKAPLRIITTDLVVFGLLIDTDSFGKDLYELHLAGGKFHKSTMTFSGAQTYTALNSYGFDKAFVGANGIIDNNVYGHSQSRGYSLRTALDSSDKRYVVTDSSKIGIRDFSTFYDLNSVTALLTDRNIDERARKSLEKYTTVLC